MEIVKELNDSSLLSQKLVDLLVDQLKHELQNHNLYKAFSAFYASKGLMKLSLYYQERASEEYEHHSWIYNYLKDNAVVFTYPTIDALDEKFKDLLDPLFITVDVEDETTDMIYAIVDQAMSEKDWITVAWLNGNSDAGKLVLEQLEESRTSVRALEIGKMDDSWLSKETAIYEMYKQR